VVIGTLEVIIQIPQSQSLKAKRQVVRSLTARLRRTFNVAVAEIGNQNTWQLATLAVVAVSADSRHVDEVCQKALDMVHHEGEALVTQSRFEIVHV
jgi:hypothetical protein